MNRSQSLYLFLFYCINNFRLQGNPFCSNSNLVDFCAPHEEDFSNIVNITNLNHCLPQSCPPTYEYAPASPALRCFCAAPVYVGYRLKSPAISDFVPYISAFKEDLTSQFSLNPYQLDIDSAEWQKGPRLRMFLKIFPMYINNSIREFNRTEVLRIRGFFSGWKIHHSQAFGPFELLNFTLSDAYRDGKSYLFLLIENYLKQKQICPFYSDIGSCSMKLHACLLAGLRKNILLLLQNSPKLRRGV